MTRAGTRIRPDERERASGPEPIGWRRRWWLNRRGRLDGRHATPDPLLADWPVVTPIRRLLLQQLTEAVAVVHEHCVREVSERECALRELAEALPQLRDLLARADREVAEAEAARPDPNVPARRRVAELGLPEELVRARRTREHTRKVETTRQRRRTIRAELDRAEQRWARLGAEIVAVHRNAVQRACRLGATFQRDLALYDRALLGRHPQAELLRPLLDVSVPPLPGWAAQPPRAERA